MNWRNNPGFVARLVTFLHKQHDFSLSKAEKAVPAVIEVISRALHRGEVVELPGVGLLKVIKLKPPGSRKFRRRLNVHTRKKPYQIVYPPKNRFRIVFIPNEELDL